MMNKNNSLSEKPAAIVLGGTAPHIYLINKLKDRGYYTILIDYYDNPPAKAYADIHVQESTLNHEAVLKTARNFSASLVISSCVDQANVTACYVAEKLNIGRPYSYATALNVSNKGRMKIILTKYNIPTAKHLFLENYNEADIANLRFPLMIKPADSCASKGVSKANDFDQLRMMFNRAKEISRINRVIVEEFINGRELSVYCIIRGGQTDVLMMSERHSFIDNQDGILKCYATVSNPNIADNIVSQIKKYANEIMRAFKLSNTPLHMQVIVDGEQVKVIEFSPRVGGGLSSRTVLLNTGFDLIEASIKSFLNVEDSQSYIEPQMIIQQNIIYAKPGVLGELKGFSELVDTGHIDEVYPYKTKGMLITNQSATSSRVGAYFVSAKTIEEINEKIREITSRIDVNDVAGKAIMRRDINYIISKNENY